MKAIKLFLIISLIFTVSVKAQFETGKHDYAGYLFAHMTSDDYGSLYYSYSSDGLSWQALNDGKPIIVEYRGHPDICKGHDGRYYMIGIDGLNHDVILWASSNLLSWEKEKVIDPEFFEVTPGHFATKSWRGAPKMFYDTKSEQYILTWHAPETNVVKDDFVAYWSSMRTFYVSSKDLKSFSEPQRLLNYDMATIDVIIRNEGEVFYAFVKDEKEASAEWPTGKSIRICTSRSLTGPYSYPSKSISPSYHEAPTIIPKLDGSGYYMY